MQRNSNNISAHPACAACKHQRKKCSDECILAQYFPATRTREFQAVHKVFGISNVTKIVCNAREEDRHKVAESLIWEALCRQKDPILGSYGEFKRIYEELKLYRSQGQGLTQPENQNYQLGQLPGQGGTSYKSGQPNLLEWDIEGGLVNDINNGLSYNNNNHDHDGNSIAALDSYCYPSELVQSSEKSNQQIREVGSVVIPMLQQQQQQPINGFSHQYYNIPGQFN